MPGLLPGPRKAVDLVASREPGPLAYLHEAVPVAQGNVVDLCSGQPRQVDEIGLPRLLLVVGFAGEVLRAAMGQHDPGLLAKPAHVETADPGSGVFRILPA